MPYIGLYPFLRYPSRTNDFSACSNPKFAHVFELGPFFLFFRLIFGFFEIFPKYIPKPISVLYLTFHPYARKNFSPFTFEPYHRYTICTPKKAYYTSNLKYTSYTSNGLSSTVKK